MIISALLGPVDLIKVGSPGSLGDRGMRSNCFPPSRVWSKIAGLPTIHPSSSLNEATSNLYVISSSSSRLENERGSQVLPP